MKTRKCNFVKIVGGSKIYDIQKNVTLQKGATCIDESYPRTSSQDMYRTVCNHSACTGGIRLPYVFLVFDGQRQHKGGCPAGIRLLVPIYVASVTSLCAHTIHIGTRRQTCRNTPRRQRSKLICAIG
jgi:hypothetical protein